MRRLLPVLIRAAGLALLMAGCGAEAEQSGLQRPTSTIEKVPTWAHEAVFYQIFPERFRNGDPSNDPARASLETPIEGRVPEGWQVTPWTSGWYARAGWEEAMGGFYDGVFDRRYGGDLQGVIDRLDYLDSLGVTALYLNPVFWARSLHKYDGNTYHHIDPHFGPDPAGDLALMREEDPADPRTWHVTAADSLFFALLDAAHVRGLRVILDGVFNHTGRDFFAFEDIRQNQQASPYAGWYAVTTWDDLATPDTSEFAYEGWWGVASLPELADTEAGDDLHPGPRQYVFDATARWMDPDGDGDPADGVDGWRLDVAAEVPLGFWADWNAHVRRLNPEAYTVAEIWKDAARFIEEGGFSATMNYHGFAVPVKGFLIDNALAPSRFAEVLNERRRAYPPAVRPVLQNLIGSHDTPRLASMIVNRDSSDLAQEQFGYDRNASPRQDAAYHVRRPVEAERQIQRLVALFQMTYVGAPMIYYGTEAGLWGADDPDDRKPMLWPDLDYDTEAHHPLGRDRPPDPVAFDHDLYRYYQDVIALRSEHEALRRGGFEVLYASDAQDLFAFSRTCDSRRCEGAAFVVVLNRSGEAQSLRVPLPEALRGGVYEQVFFTPEGAAHRVQQDPTGLLLELPALGGMVLRRDA